MSDIVKYYESNPDYANPGCRNTGKIEDGVEFVGFEPRFGAASFVGRTSIVEAVGLLFGLQPNEVKARLGDGGNPHKETVKTLRAELKASKAALAAVRTSVGNALLDPGLPSNTPARPDELRGIDAAVPDAPAGTPAPMAEIA